MGHLRIAALVLCVVCTGCVRGWIFTDQTTPLTLNLDDTPVAREQGKHDVKHLFWPYPQLDLQWDQNAIGEIAKKKGMKKVYYADLHTFAIFGIWRRYTVHVYGE